MRRVLLCLSLLPLALAAVSAAGDQEEAQLVSIEVAPTDVVLRGAWSSQSLVVHGKFSDGAVHDLTDKATYALANAQVAVVDASGLVRPVADGKTTISVSAEDGSATQAAEVFVSVQEHGNDAVDFLNHVVPTITRLGCNAAKCHGSSDGKGGFKLSMFAADPRHDYDGLVKSADGKRVNLDDPAKSLFLLKATSSVEHKGGKKFEKDSADDKQLVAWVAQGAPLVAEQAAKLTAVKIVPDQLTLAKGSSRRLLTTAVYSDGSRRDVSRDARFASSDERVVTIREDGRAEAVGFGEAVVVATYRRMSSIARIASPQALPFGFPEAAPQNKIDEFVWAKLKQLGIPPAELCSDDEFLRRVYLDVLGTLPGHEEARAFLADTDPQKRAKLIDRLLASQEFADFWALKWGDLLRIKSEYPAKLWPNAVQAYHRWVRESIAQNKPYDQFARELITASGSNFRNPPANYYRAFLKKDPQDFADATALVFMGARIGCARCHGHPTESWTSEDTLGLAAFFAPVRFKSTTEWKEEIIFVKPGQRLNHPQTGEPVNPKFLDGATLEVDAKDPRVKFANWLTSPDNPWFARNIANRVWFWLLGRGIVHEPDDLRSTNPPANPELLEYMEQELVSHDYNLKHLYRLILNSRTYQLSAKTTRWNENDLSQYSHYYVKRLGAETLLDAIGQVTERWDTYRSSIPEPFVKMPTGFRATHLADGSIGTPFLELFGRPPRDTAYESDRGADLSMRQTLHLLNSVDVHNKIRNSPRLKRLLKQKKGHAKIVDEIYLSTLSRFPTKDEQQKILDYLAEQQKALPQAFEDLVWAVLNTKEFVFNH